MKIVKETNLRDCVGNFPSFPYDIWTPAQLSASEMPEDCLFGWFNNSFFPDVVGFLQYVSPICKVKNSGFWDKEMAILLSCKRNKLGG